ncbi:MAG: pyridoxamine kinase [Lachnospiraceae bacterium]
MENIGQKKVAVIEDMCGFGRCSMTVALPLISAYGIQACPVLTALFSNHTAFDSIYREDLTDGMMDYVKPWKQLGLKFDGIMSGYLANVNQIEHVIEFISEFRKKDTIVVVDPVMGDNGKLYKYIDDTMKDRLRMLVTRADVVTPNVTECCAITGTPYSDSMSMDVIRSMGVKLLDMGPENVVITGIPMKTFIGNLCVTGSGTTLIKRKKTGDTRCGTGDAFTAVLTALLVNGCNLETAVRKTSAFIAKAIARSDRLGIDKRNGIAFEKFMKLEES